MITNNRKRHQLRQQFERGQSIMAQAKALGNAPLVALGSDPKRAWADVGFVKTFKRYLKRQRALDADGVASEPVVAVETATNDHNS